MGTSCEHDDARLHFKVPCGNVERFNELFQYIGCGFIYVGGSNGFEGFVEFVRC